MHALYHGQNLVEFDRHIVMLSFCKKIAHRHLVYLRCWLELYISQTKMLPCWKSEPTFPNAFPGEALFKGVSTRFWPRIVEKCFPGKRIRKGWFGLPTWQHLRLGSINLKVGSRVHSNYSSCLCVTRLRVALPCEVNTLLKRTLSNSQLHAP